MTKTALWIILIASNAFWIWLVYFHHPSLPDSTEPLKQAIKARDIQIDSLKEDAKIHEGQIMLLNDKIASQEIALKNIKIRYVPIKDSISALSDPAALEFFLNNTR